MGIELIHWGSLDVRSCHGELGHLVALWPEPLDHDACFEKAGFDRFADSDAAWHNDFATVVQDLLATLGAYGGPVVSGKPIIQRPRTSRLFRKRAPELRLFEQIAIVAHDDQFGSIHVDFGTPVRAAVDVSDGHPILWIWLHRDVAHDLSGHLNAVAQARRLIETTLRWDALLPESLLRRR